MDLPRRRRAGHCTSGRPRHGCAPSQRATSNQAGCSALSSGAGVEASDWWVRSHCFQRPRVRRRMHAPPIDEEDAGQLHQVRAEPAVLAQPEVLVEGALNAPEHHGRPDHDPGGVTRPARPVRPAVEASLNGDQDEVDGEVLEGLEDRDREPAAGLVRVVHAEPLVCRVATARHHQLGAQEPAQGPAGQQDGSHQVERPTERQLRTATARQDDADRHREEQATEGGEASLPDGQDVPGPLRCSSSGWRARASPERQPRRRG